MLHCPRAVSLANRMAIESPEVTSVIVEAREYPDLVRKYQVSGVPKTMVNEEVEILGARPLALRQRRRQQPEACRATATNTTVGPISAYRQSRTRRTRPRGR